MSVVLRTYVVLPIWLLLFPEDRYRDRALKRVSGCAVVSRSHTVAGLCSSFCGSVPRSTCAFLVCSAPLFGALPKVTLLFLLIVRYCAKVVSALLWSWLRWSQFPITVWSPVADILVIPGLCHRGPGGESPKCSAGRTYGMQSDGGRVEF